MRGSLVPAATGRRPSALRLLGRQTGFATTELWRSRVAFVFTFLFPLTWLLLLGVLVDNPVVDDAGTRMMQYVTPVAAAMGILYGTFPTLATTLASARERGTLRRVRGTPLPGWIYLSGRIGAAVVFAVGSLLTMLVVGVAIFDVQIVWRTAVAATVTVLAAVACFASAGLAVASLARRRSSPRPRPSQSPSFWHSCLGCSPRPATCPAGCTRLRSSFRLARSPTRCANSSILTAPGWGGMHMHWS